MLSRHVGFIITRIASLTQTASQPSMRFCIRKFGADSRAMSKSAEDALQSIKEAREKAHKLKLNAMSKKERRKFPGNFMNFKLGGGRPEFYHVERNQNGRIFEPDHVFEIVVYGTKNNCQATVINKSWNRRTVSLTNAGRVGIRKCKRKGNKTAERIGQSVAKKMRRLGVSCADLRFRYLMRIGPFVRGLTTNGLKITSVTHEPRLPKGKVNRPRKRRRV